MALDPNSPQVLTKVWTEQEATLLVNHLAAEGIKAHIAGAGTSTGWPKVPSDVQVVVRQADVTLAKELLDLVQQRLQKIRG